MSDEKKASRINIEDLPQAEQELTTEQAKDVKGGVLIGLLLPAVQKVAPIAPLKPGVKGGNVEFEWKVEEGES